MTSAPRWLTPFTDNHHTLPSCSAYMWVALISRNNPTCASWETACWGNNPLGQQLYLNPTVAPF